MFALGGDKLTQFKMTFIARKLTNTIAFFITDSRSTGEMCGQNSAGEKSLFFANIFAKNNQRHLLGKKATFLHEQK